MIVRSVQEGWQIVFHSAHALLALRLATLLKRPALPFWFETCVAIGMHDDQKLSFERGAREYLTSAGAPLDFTLLPMKKDTRLCEARRQINEARRKHQWIGLLVSMHADFLYRDEHTSADMNVFLDAESERRSEVLRELKVEEDLLQQSYNVVQWCDRCSLVLCGEEVPAMGRRLEISELPGYGRVEIFENDQEELHLEPWPFEDERVTVNLEQRVVGQLEFTDDAELWNALMECKPDRREMVLLKSP